MKLKSVEKLRDIAPKFGILNDELISIADEIEREVSEHYMKIGFRHVKPRTVENVLRDFGVDVAHELNANPDATISESTIAKYVLELQMRGGLQPCPFCGGEASKRLFYKGKYRVHCNVCDAHSGDVCDTEAEAIAAWNTRAELGSGTCENVSDPPEGFLCSACGWGDFAEPSHLLTTAKFTGNEHGPNFCPNYGKVVKR